jgi:hypothetical protein
MPRRLRAVDPGETAKPRRLSVTQAAAEGTYHEMLLATQARIAAAVQSDCNPVALAALSRQLLLISKELSMLAARVLDDAAMPIPDEPFDHSAV